MKKVIGILVVIIVIGVIAGITINNVKKDKKIKEDEQNDKEFNQRLVEDFGRIQVFIDNDATEEEIEDLRNSINNIEKVREIEYKSKDEALNELRNKFSDKSLLDAYEGENNIFPNSFIVKIDTNIKAEDIDDTKTKIIEEIEKLDNVDKCTTAGGLISIKAILEYHKESPELSYDEVMKNLDDILGINDL